MSRIIVDAIRNSSASSDNINLDSSGNVGVSTTAPVEKLGVAGNMRFVNPTGETKRIIALPSGGYNLGTTGGAAIAFHRISDGGGGSDEIAFETHWQGNRHGESARISKFGGITFNGDTAAANALDDYEEGTWTPINVNFSTYSNVTWDATYTKIGRFVMCNAVQTAGDTSWGVSQQLRGLPFQVEKTGAGTWTNNAPSDGGELLVWDNEYLYFSQARGNVSSDHRLRITFMYQTAA